jgi:hypothetical protein
MLIYSGVAVMSRVSFVAWAGSLAILLAGSIRLPATERGTDESPEAVKARREVRAALKAEAAGENDERLQRLESARSAAPELAEPNWHSAKVRLDERWLALAEAEKQAASDSRLAEYRKFREDAKNSPRLLRDLARWCMKAGWDDTGRVHYAQLLARSDVDDDTLKEAITRLDLQLVAGEWLTGDEMRARQQRARAIDAALRVWRPRLKKLQLAIDGDEPAPRDYAIRELAKIDDPQIIIALESFQLDGGDRFCEEAVKRLATFPQIEATEALARFAVLSSFTGARDSAVKALKERPKHDYVPLLMAGLMEPIKSQFSIGVGRNGTIQYVHAVEQENAEKRVVRVANRVAVPVTYIRKTGRFRAGANVGGGNSKYLFAQLDQAQAAAAQLENEKAFANFQASETNRRVFQVLEHVTDLQLDRQPSQWWQWWQQFNEYNWQKPSYWAYQSASNPYFGGATSCFLAGTPVRTQSGLRSIEWLQAGDRVLSQDQDTGELTYKVVVRTTVRPPAKLVRITTAADEIVTTLGHPFWVNGHGWKMAKELVAGDLLHSLGGAVRVEKVEPAGEDKAYNLVVDDFNTYFVGQAGLLVHDNEFRKPTRAIVPGLIEEVAAVTKK